MEDGTTILLQPKRVIIEGYTTGNSAHSFSNDNLGRAPMVVTAVSCSQLRAAATGSNIYTYILYIKGGEGGGGGGCGRSNIGGKR